MLDKELLKVLSKIYRYENVDYIERENDSFCYQYRYDEVLTVKQQIVLRDRNFDINEIIEYEHDSFIKEVNKIVKKEELEIKVIKFFIYALATGFHRGISPIISYYYSKNMKVHNHIPLKKEQHDNMNFQKENHCKICGLKPKNWINNSESIYKLYMCHNLFTGNSYTNLIDLTEIDSLEVPIIKKEYIDVLNNVILLIEKAEEKESMSILRERLSKAKLLPNSNPTTRHWIVNVLAGLGIIRTIFDGEEYGALNKFVDYSQRQKWELDLHKSAPQNRAEVYFPMSGWRGKLGVNKKLLNEMLSKI